MKDSTPTPEELKAEAIKKAWIAEIGEEAFELLHSQIRHEDGGLSVIGEFDLINQTREILGEKLQETDKFKFDGRNLYLVALSGIEKNRGWIRIEPDGSNLPTIEGTYWVMHADLGLTQAVYSPSEDEIEDDSKDWFLNYCTHYQEITKPQPPIF